MRGLKIGSIVMINQPNIHKKLSENRERNKKKRRRGNENLSFSDYVNLMRHYSYYRGRGGAIKQKK